MLLASSRSRGTTTPVFRVLSSVAGGNNNYNNRGGRGRPPVAPNNYNNNNAGQRPPRPEGYIPYPTTNAVGNKVGGFVLRNDPAFRLKFESKPTAEAPTPVPRSPWHDVQLYSRRNEPTGLYINMVTEIPYNTVEKMEIATKEEYNPIKQDIKKEKLRQYPFASLVNYGAIPQTWEDPNHVDSHTGLKGDNDPLDVVEIGNRVGRMGEIVRVKVLGVLGMIDEGEMDWKIVAIHANNSLAQQLNSVADVEAAFPGKIASIVQWFKMYKVPDGKPENAFAFNDKMQDAEFARKVIADCHEAWKNKEAMKAKGLWVG